MDYAFILESNCELIPAHNDTVNEVLAFPTESAAREHVRAIPRREWTESGKVVGWSQFETLDLPPKHHAIRGSRLYGNPGARAVAIWGRRAYEADGTPYNDKLSELGGYLRLVRVPFGP